MLTIAVATCTDSTDPSEPEPSAEERVWYDISPTGALVDPPEVFVGAGDIAHCSKTGDSQTAALLDSIPGEVFALGDNVYPNGTASEFTNCYEPTWGRHKARTHPSAGNHDYNSSNATPYFNYFGAAAGTPGEGYYSFDLGAWHIIVLNSNISRTASSPQVQWLRADLAAHPNLCTLAYWHHPLYSSTGGSGSGGTSYTSVRPFWDTLYAAGVDLVLGGHRHFYERLAPMKPDGSADNAFGIRQIIVGSGGVGGGSLTNLHPRSEVGNGTTFGVLKLYLYEDSYAWKFDPVAGKTFSDSGSTACHSTPVPTSVSAAQSTVVAAPEAIPASGGASASTITVTAKNASGNPVSGATVVLTASGSGNTLIQPAGPTDANGVATGTLSSTVTGAKTVSATITGVAVTQTATVTVNPATASALAFAVQPTNTAAAATITPAVNVEIRDPFGNRVTGATNSVTVAIGTNPAGATLSGTNPVAAVDGVATFSALSINNAGTGYTLAASASGLSDATSNAFDITAAPPSASESRVSAAPATIEASNGSSASTITVTARDGSGSPMSGVTVALSATGSGNTITQAAEPTDANGMAMGSLSSTIAGPKTVTAVAGGVTLSDQPVVTVTAGPANASQSTVAASPTTIVTGSGSSTITVTVKDALGNPVSGSTVSLSADPATGNTLTQPTGPTNASGVATGTLSSTVEGTKTVSAAAGGTTITQTATVTVTSQIPVSISHTLLTSGNNTVNQKIYTTAAISPAPDALITVAVLSHRSTAAVSPTLSGGGMATWVEVASVDFDPVSLPLKRMTIFRAMSPSPGSGPITITFASSVSNCQWIVSQWDGVEISGLSGSGAIGQIGSNRADVVSGLVVSLGTFGNANNVAYGVFGVNSQSAAINPGTGFTEIGEQPSAESPGAALQAEWAVNRSTIDATWTNLRGGALGVEIKAATGP